MSARERRIKEGLNASRAELIRVAVELKKIGFNQIAYDIDVIVARLHNINGMTEKLQCPECNKQNVSLSRGEGWFCNICNAGPFIVTTGGLKPNT